MSWSVSATLPDPSSDVNTMKESALSQNPECSDQFDAALAAMSTIIASGTVGDQSKQFYVSMSGHSNPNHEPREGWANDMITISIRQK
jgi:hypothetical protein